MQTLRSTVLHGETVENVVSRFGWALCTSIAYGRRDTGEEKERAAAERASVARVETGLVDVSSWLSSILRLIPFLTSPFHPCRAQSLLVLSFVYILSHTSRQTRVAPTL